MKYRDNGIEYEVKEVTAIAVCEEGDETKRQEALLVTANNGTETDEQIVFGWKTPRDWEEFSEMCADPGAWEPLEEGHHVKA